MPARKRSRSALRGRGYPHLDRRRTLPPPLWIGLSFRDLQKEKCPVTGSRRCLLRSAPNYAPRAAADAVGGAGHRRGDPQRTKAGEIAVGRAVAAASGGVAGVAASLGLLINALALEDLRAGVNARGISVVDRAARETRNRPTSAVEQQSYRQSRERFSSKSDLTSTKLKREPMNNLRPAEPGQGGNDVPIHQAPAVPHL